MMFAMKLPVLSTLFCLVFLEYMSLQKMMNVFAIVHINTQLSYPRETNVDLCCRTEEGALA